MRKYDKLVFQILRGMSDANIAFTDLVNLLKHLGFYMRIKGSHHVFRKNGVIEKVNLQYEIIIYWSDEDQAFIAEAPELPGCMAHGDTHEAALTNIKTAMELWMETAKEFNDHIPVPQGRRLAFA